MASTETLPCPGCRRSVTPDVALEDRCACGDSLADHGDGSDNGDDGDRACRACACLLFEWDGSLSCPACLGELDQAHDERRSTRKAA